MQLIKCTKKLQKEMGLKKNNISENEPKESCLGSWHANLIYIDGKKSVLFANDKTLFNFIVPNIPRAEIKKLSKVFKHNLECVLSSEGISEEMKTKILLEYKSIEYGNTTNKSVLGSLNDLAFHYKHRIALEGGDSHAIPDIINKLNHMPMGALEYLFPIEALKNELKRLT